VLAVLRSAGNLHRANDLVARAAGRHELSALVASLRRNAASRFAPPQVGPRAPLTDLLVHGGDIRVRLGLAHEPDGAAVTTALQFLTHGRPVGFVSRGRLAGLRLSATDLDWSHGRGAELAGRGVDLADGGLWALRRAAQADRSRRRHPAEQPGPLTRSDPAPWQDRSAAGGPRRRRTRMAG